MIPSSCSAEDAGTWRARSWRAWIAWLGLALLTGCDRRGAAEFPTRSAHADDDRRAAGIAVDLTLPPPTSRDRAETKDAIVALRTPLGLEAAHETVDRFFDAVFSEDIAALAELVQDETQVQDTRASASAKAHPAAALWRQRFQKREYQALSGALVYRATDVGTYRGDQTDELPLDVRYLSSEDDVLPNDVVLHVPIITHSLRSERLFGDDIFFWLRRRGSRYVIYRMAEEVPF